MSESGYVLVVGGQDVPDTLGVSLGAALPVRVCSGPGSTDCPAERREPCPLRTGAKASIVYLAGEHEFHSRGRWDCVTASDAPVVVVVGGGTQPPSARDGFAIVGASLGPAGVLEALASLVDTGDRA